MFLYDFATKTAQKPDTVATYIRRNEKIFKNHVERREKQLWLDEKAVKILLKKYPEVQRKKYPWWKNETEFEEAMVNAIKGLWDNQEILQKELDGILTAIAELQDAMDQKEPQKENNGLTSVSKDVSTCENNKRHVGDSCKTRKHICLRLFSVTIFRKKQATYLSDKRQIELVGILPNPESWEASQTL